MEFNEVPYNESTKTNNPREESIRRMIRMEALDKYSKKLDGLGWWDFPFIPSIIPQVYLGQKNLESLLPQVKIGNLVIVEGSYGTGKTQLFEHLKYLLSERPDDYIPILVSEPPETLLLSESIVTELRKIFGITQAPPTVIDELVSILRDVNRRIVLLIDEAQLLIARESENFVVKEKKRRDVQWIRVLVDLSNVVVFLAGLPDFSKSLFQMFIPLEDRVTRKLRLEPLNLAETSIVIRKRIEYFGGTGIKPFQEDAIKEIFSHTQGYPRAVIKLCGKVVEAFLNSEAAEITKELVNEIAIEEGRVEIVEMITDDIIKVLTPAQNEVLRVLANSSEMQKPDEVAKRANLTIGGSGNILRDLHEQGFIKRELRGRAYYYYVAREDLKRIYLRG